MFRLPRRFRSPRRRVATSPRHAFRPRLEVLEDRLTPVTINPGDYLIADSDDSAAGSRIIRVSGGVQSIIASGTTFDSASGIAVAANGDLLIPDFNALGGTGAVFRVNPATGGVNTVSSAGSFANPYGIALDGNGDIFVADFGTTAVIRVNPITGAQTVVASAGSFQAPDHLAIAANGDLLVADPAAFSGPGGVIRVNPTSMAQTVVSSAGSFAEPQGIAVAANGDVYVADTTTFGGSGAIIRINPALPNGSNQSVFSQNGAQGNLFVNPGEIAFDANGDLLVVDGGAFGGAGGLIRVNAATGMQSQITSGGSFRSPRGVAVSTVLAYATTANSASNNLVLRKTGSNLELLDNGSVVASGPLSQCKSIVIQSTPGENDRLTIDPSLDPNLITGGIRFLDGTRTVNPGDLLVVDPNAFGGSGGIIRVDPTQAATSNQTLVSSGGTFSNPLQIAIAANGDLIVTDENEVTGLGRVTRLNPATGAQTIVSSAGSLLGPRGLAIDANGNILVAALNADAIIRVDPLTGSQTVISSGGSFTSPYDIEVASNGDLLVADPDAFGGTGAIFRVANQPGGSTQTTVSSGANFLEPRQLAIESNGNLIVTNTPSPTTSQVIRVNPMQPPTSNQTVVSQNGGSQGNLFTTLAEIAIAANGDLLIADPEAFGGDGGVIRVNPVTGLQSEVSSGSSFVDPRGITLATFLSFTTPSGNGTDSMLLRLAQNGTMLQLLNNSVIVAEGPASQCTAVVIRGADGETDSLSLDFSGGNFNLPGGIRFDGATGSDQILVGADTDLTLTNTQLLFGTGLVVNLTSVERASLYAGFSDNLLDASAFTLGPVTLDGAAGNDTLRGGSGNDFLNAREDNDSIVGGAGNDTLDGGTGSDTLSAGDGDDLLLGGTGNDTLDGGTGTADTQGESGPGLGTDFRTNIDFYLGGQLEFNATSYSVGEGDGVAVITVNRFGGNSGQVTINFAASNGSATAGSDYTTSSGTLTFNDGEDSKTFSITITNDSTAEGNETVNLTLSNAGGGAAVGGTLNATLTITDNDTADILVSPTSGLTSTEAGGTATFTVVLTSIPTADVTIGLSSNDLSEGTVSPSSLTFTPANAFMPQTVTLTGVDDALSDGAILYTIITAAALSSDGVYNGRNAADVSAANNDNEIAGVTVTPTAGLIVTEAGGMATFAVSLNTLPTQDVFISLNTSDATEGTVSPAMLTFTTANGTMPQTVTITGVDDALVDGGVGFMILTTASSSDPAYNGIPVPDVAATTTDDEQPGQLQFNMAAYSVNEDGGTATITVARSNGSDGTVTVQYATNNGSATEGADYTLASGTLTFAPGVLSQSFNVAILDDNEIEGDETVNLTLTTPSGGATIGSRNTAVLTIVDVEARPVQFSMANFTAAEDAGSVVITVIRGGSPDVTVAVDFTTGGGTAAAGANGDYDTVAGTLTFAPGVTSQTFTITLFDDFFLEGNETVGLTLSNPSNGATLGTPATATLTITDAFATIIGTAGDDQFNFASFSEPVRIEGLGGNDLLIGGSGNDTLLGGDGTDTITGNGGNDALDGGLQIDLLAEQGDVSFVLSDTALSGLGTDLLAGFERAALTGGLNAHSLDASLFSGPVTLTGGVSADTLLGGAGPDQLIGAGSGDSLVGGGGNDTLDGAEGDDRLAGGDGDDVLSGGSGRDILDGGLGNDSLDAAGDDDSLTGGDGNDTLAAGSGRDTLIGDAGQDSLDAGDGDDILRAGDGDDTLMSGSGNDDLDGGPGANDLQIETGVEVAPTDTRVNIEALFLTGTGNDNNFNVSAFTGTRVTVDAGEGNDTITSGAATATLIGGPGNDMLVAGNANDMLMGGDGDDLLCGNPGDDTLDGGAGIDTLMEAADVSFTLSDASLTGLGSDTLMSIDQASLAGGGSANTLNAAAFTLGPVTLDGGLGDDTLMGSLANDQLSGGLGVDCLMQTADADQALTNTSVTGLGTDSLTSIDEAHLIGGGSANALSASGFGGPVTLDGLAGADTLISGNANDTLLGGLGDDLLCGALGNDQLDGGDGLDRVIETADANFTLTNTTLVGVGTDTLAAVEQASLTGGAAGNTLSAAGFTLGSVTLDGGSGNDTLTGGSANDLLAGGLGLDLLQTSVNGAVTLSDVLLMAGGVGADALSSIDAADVTGGAGADLFTVSGFTGTATLTGAAGDDTVRTQNDADFEIAGGQLSRFLGGTAQLLGLFQLSLVDDLQIIGEGGDNLFCMVPCVGPFNCPPRGSFTGGGGTDRIKIMPETPQSTIIMTDAAVQITGDATYTLNGISEATLTGTAGTDQLDASGTSRRVSLTGGPGNDTLLGGSGDDTLSGGDGSDNLTGGGGQDRLIDTLAFNPTLSTTKANAKLVIKNGKTTQATDLLFGIEEVHLIGDAGNNVMNASSFKPGPVTLDGGAGDDKLTGARFADALLGGDGKDKLTGGSGNDTLSGGAGDDNLLGGAGDDLLDGGLDLDTANGGSGNDTCQNAEIRKGCEVVLPETASNPWHEVFSPDLRRKRSPGRLSI